MKKENKGWESQGKLNATDSVVDGAIYTTVGKELVTNSVLVPGRVIERYWGKVSFDKETIKKIYDHFISSGEDQFIAKLNDTEYYIHNDFEHIDSMWLTEEDEYIEYFEGIQTLEPAGTLKIKGYPKSEQ